jgi:ketosteroid isomerase-like protein
MKNKGKENVIIVKDFYRALASGDQCHAHTLLDPSTEWIEHGEDLCFGGRRIGRQLVFDEVIEPTHDKIREFEFKVKKCFAVGDRVVVLGRETGRGRVTDLKLDAPVMHLWTVKNGKLASCEAFHDLLEWQVVLGQTTVQSQQLAA